MHAPSATYRLPARGCSGRVADDGQIELLAGPGEAMNFAEISVVMSVFNDISTLPDALASVLGQKECELEFIVIDDGSTDGSGALLDQWAQRDSRLQVIHQQNAGLTRALMRGCELARGEFIARQDADDASLPGRFAAQAQVLRRSSEYVAASCHVEFIGPNGEFLYRSGASEHELNETLHATGGTIRGPAAHGSVMMRSQAYRACGGYRQAFYFAQDLDLWSRLRELGCFCVIPQVLYRAGLHPGAISGMRSAEQRQLTRLIAQLTAARRENRDESQLLAAAAQVRPAHTQDREQRLAQGNYFIGSCLRKRLPNMAMPYFREALRHDPWHWKARLRLLQTQFAVLRPATAQTIHD
jgi:GT2 family glycosyltransferase